MTRALGGQVEVFSVCGHHRHFPKHTHPELALALVQCGVMHFEQAKRQEAAHPGALIVTPPGEAHSGGGGGPRGLTHHTLYVTEEALHLLGFSATPFLPALHARPDFALLFGAVDQAISSGETLRVESTLTELLHALMPVDPPQSSPNAWNAARVKPARDYLHAHFAQAVPLMDLAALCGLHPGSLVRLFRNTLGVPPHVYQQGLRLQHARRLINAGSPLAQTALEAGFADQSHFTRAFTRMFGLPPGQYAQGSDHSRRVE